MAKNNQSSKLNDEIISGSFTNLEIIELGSSTESSTESSSENSSDSSKLSSTESSNLSSDKSTDESSNSYADSSEKSYDIDTDDEVPYTQINAKQIIEKFTDLESSIIMLKHNNQKRFEKLETDLTICKKNIGDMSRRIFDLEDENNNFRISNVDMLQKLEEQEKLNDYLIKKFIEMKGEKQKTLHFISRRNDFI